MNNELEKNTATNIPQKNKKFFLSINYLNQGGIIFEEEKLLCNGWRQTKNSGNLPDIQQENSRRYSNLNGVLNLSARAQVKFIKILAAL